MLAALYVSNKSHAETYEGLDVKVEGKGAAVIFIPGLNSAATVFTEACDAIKAKHQCHLLQLPGFAGNPARANISQGCDVNKLIIISHENFSDEQ